MIGDRIKVRANTIVGVMEIEGTPCEGGLIVVQHPAGIPHWTVIDYCYGACLLGGFPTHGEAIKAAEFLATITEDWSRPWHENGRGVEILAQILVSPWAPFLGTNKSAPLTVLNDPDTTGSILPESA